MAMLEFEKMDGKTEEGVKTPSRRASKQVPLDISTANSKSLYRRPVD